jgi:hypothetical protein
MKSIIKKVSQQWLRIAPSASVDTESARLENKWMGFYFPDLQLPWRRQPMSTYLLSV